MPNGSTNCGNLEAAAPAQIKMRVAPQPAPIHSCCGDGCCSDCAGMSRARISPSDGRVKLSIEAVPGYRLDYNNQVQDDCALANVDFGNGTNWMVAISPALIKYIDGSVAIRFSPEEGYWFATPSGFAPQFGAKVGLSHDAGADEYVLELPDGTLYRFHDYDQTTYPKGSFKSYTTPGGIDVTAVSYNAASFLEEIQKSFSVPGEFGAESAVVESLQMQYAATGPSESLQVQTVTARRKLDGGPLGGVRPRHHGLLGQRREGRPGRRPQARRSRGPRRHRLGRDRQPVLPILHQRKPWRAAVLAQPRIDATPER